MIQILQICGAVLLLVGFVAAQLGHLRDTSVLYLAVNACGGLCLAAIALAGRDWGFLLLEGAWAMVSLVGLFRRSGHQVRSTPPEELPAAAHGRGKPATSGGTARTAAHHAHRRSIRSSRARRLSNGHDGPERRCLPPQRVARCAGDELSEPGRLIRLIRDSYAGAQGRQWLQPHVLWWTLTFLRRHGVAVDWTALTAPSLAETVTALPLPPGHTDVQPADQAPRNFGLWWALFVELTHTAYRPRWQPRRHRLPDATQLDERARHLGLQPWMSSASFEEISGIARALACLHPYERRRGTQAPDDFMLQVLLPELLIVELHWLHAPAGRPRTGHGPSTDVILLRRYDKALTKWTHGNYVTPLDHMYLRAGDILHHLPSTPAESTDPALLPIIDMHRQLQNAQAERRRE